MKHLLCALFALLLSCSLYAADLYVDGLNGHDANPGTEASPYKTPWKAWLSAKPGDMIHLLPTVTYGAIWLSRNQGAAGLPITIRGTGKAPNRTKIHAKDTQGIMTDATSYLRIENFDVLTSDATKRASHGIFMKDSHHIEVVNNRVKATCSGIQTWSTDYITIDGNEVYDSANRTLQNIWCSGISTHENLDIDENTTDYKTIITNNIVYGTLNVAEPNCTKCLNSDGSGIIIDDSRRTQTDNRSYKGRHLVANNVLFNNGGRGITSYISDNVDILHNTIHGNNVDPSEGAWKPGEITVDQGFNIRIIGNILSSDGLIGRTTDQHVGLHVSNTTGLVEVGRNLMWNPQGDHSVAFYFKNNTGPVLTAGHNRFAPPGFVKASPNPTLANYKVKSSSAARAMPAVKGTYPKTDINGLRRGTRTLSAGAYR